MKSAEETSQKLTEKIAASAFSVFTDKKFRKMIDFENLEQTEADRIFNELLVTGICLAVLNFKYIRDNSSRKNEREFFNELHIEMKSSYSDWLQKLGTAKEFTNLWKELIRMRTEEYENDYTEHKDELTKNGYGDLLVPVIAFGCFCHIRKGKLDEKDTLFPFLTTWVKELSRLITTTFQHS